MAVKLSDIMSGSITFENILSVRVLEWLVVLVGCKIKGINELEASESKISFFWLCSGCCNGLVWKEEYDWQCERFSSLWLVESSWV